MNKKVEYFIPNGLKITQKRLNDIETIKYFIPKMFNSIKITNEDINDFFMLSDKGISNTNKPLRTALTVTSTPSIKFDGFISLNQGKRWREWHMRTWEESILDGTIPYHDLLREEDGTLIPYLVVKYMKKSMFKGADKDVIEDLYQSMKYETN